MSCREKTLRNISLSSLMLRPKISMDNTLLCVQRAQVVEKTKAMRRERKYQLSVFQQHAHQDE
tara:strand:+ start:1219 stop:1407 length:189 start_codon:yes stop_codon:yes gene_type:complete